MQDSEIKSKVHIVCGVRIGARTSGIFSLVNALKHERGVCLQSLS